MTIHEWVSKLADAKTPEEFAAIAFSDGIDIQAPPLKPAYRLPKLRPIPKLPRDHNAYLRSIAIETGPIGTNAEYWIIRNPLHVEWDAIRAKAAAGEIPPWALEHMTMTKSMASALNGYVAFPKRHAPITGSKPPILAYVPVHGGITYFEKDRIAAVYGFDTCHYNSDNFPRDDPKWIQFQCQILYRGLIIAATIKKDYMRFRSAGNNQRCIETLKPLVEMLPELGTIDDLGFEALLNILRGKV